MQSSVDMRFGALRWKRLKGFVHLFGKYAGENRNLMALALASGVGATAMRLLLPWPLKLLFDGVLIPDERIGNLPFLAWVVSSPVDAVVLYVCTGLLVITLIWGLCSYAQTYLTARTGQIVVFSLRQRVYSHLLRLSLGFHEERQSGDLVMRLTGDVSMLRDMIVDAALMATSEGLMLGAMVIVMLVMDVPLALVALAILPLMALTTLKFSSRIREAARRQRKKEGRVGAMVSEMLQSVRVIQAFGQERQQERHFQRGNRRSLKAGLRTTRLEATMSVTVEVLLAVGTAGVLWLGVHRVLAGVLTPGDLLVFTAYLHSSYRPLRKLARVASRLSRAVVCAERVTEVLESTPDVESRPDARKLRRAEGAIGFRGVRFEYKPGKPVLRRISFDACPGQFIGIAGPSGAGKSTILALVLRLYDPSHGKVTLDGRDLTRLDLASLREQISVVLQEPILFGTTVRDNIAFGKPDASDEEIEAAARSASAHEFISQLPDGYDTAIAEAGSDLSSGQRQRLAIARAFLRDAPILLLDEPTQGLDAHSADEFRSALIRLIEGRTTIMVAHSLELLKVADEILVLRKGRIQERGTDRELRELGGWYARSHALQQEDTRVTAPRGHSPHRKAGLAPGPGARLLDRAAVTEALLEEGLLSPTQAPIRLARAWPSKTGSLVALYEGGQTGNWALHGGEPPHDGELHQALDAGRARRLIGIPALAHRIEDDPALPAISSRIRGAEATGELRALLGNPSIDPADVRARVVSYKPLRRCVIRYEIASEGDPRTFFGKIFRNGHSRLIWERYAALDTAGPDFAFARPISYESETEMILWRGETGSSLTDIIQTDQARFGVTRAARLLASLHASKTPWSGKHDREREIRTTDSWVRLIATLWPEPGEALSGWWDLGGVDIQRAPEALLPAHRDFYESQVILNGDSATLIDLDTACLAEPELDVANFLAHLELGHLEGRGENPMELEIAFLDAYTASGGRTDPIRLNFYRTSALVRLACVHALRSNAWGSLSAHLLDLARECRTSDLTVRGAI